MKLKANVAADGAILLTTIIWGTTFIVAREVLDTWPPVSYLAVRMTTAALILAALFPRRLARADRAAVRAGVTLGLLIGGGVLGLTVALLYTTPARTAFIASLTTPLVPFAAYALFRERPGRENLAGVALATVGGALVLAPAGRWDANAGDILALGCTLLFATHVALLGHYARRHDARLLSVLQIIAAAAVLCSAWLAVWVWAAAGGEGSLPAGLARELSPPPWDARAAWQIAYLSVVATVVTFLLWTWGQARMPAAHAAVIFSLEPVFATLFAVMARGPGEWPGGRANWGALLIVSGVVVSEIKWGKGKAGKKEGGDGTETGAAPAGAP
ncbi:MAG TPA: DMT family transporter [Pyrinomonadaceae bacterium]|nr:DMT family transporter [Pyrinomonadaceae bacterium]